MTEPTPDCPAQICLRENEGLRSQSAGAWLSIFRASLCAWLCIALLACGGGSGGDSGGGGGGDGGDTPLATEPVDLPPGETVARLEWEPSEGFVSNYMVFLSRNHGSFDFNQLVPEPNAQITGAPGDEIRITVVAISTDGDFSPASPPSVEIRFHPAAPGAFAQNSVPTSAPIGVGSVSVPDPAEGASDPTPTNEVTPVGDTPGDGSDGTAGDVASETPGVDDGNGVAEAPVEEPSVDEGLSASARETLLLADARLPLARLGAGAAAWLQSQVEIEGMTGVSLIGTARGADAGMRDLVWQDAAGQLFVSAGGSLRDAQAPVSTLVAMSRLQATERFVALADVDGDGIRDFVVEDVVTGEAWLRTDDPANDRPARTIPSLARLLGSGDFDGDGTTELLWQDAQRALTVERPNAAPTTILSGALPPADQAILAVADLTGDGRDDLIARGEDGLLSVGVVGVDVDGAGLRIEWSEGHADADAAVELVATLDLDGDARAELAWLVDGSVEVRALGETVPRSFEF